MNRKIDYSISDKKENNPVGYIKDNFSGEIIEYFSEIDLLNEYKRSMNNMGFSGVAVRYL